MPQLWDLMHLADACGLEALQSGVGSVGHDVAMRGATNAQLTSYLLGPVYFLMIDLVTYYPIAYVGVAQNARQYAALHDERYELRESGRGEEGRQKVHQAYWIWCRENVFDDSAVMPAFHPVFRQQAYNLVVPTHVVYPHEETSDGSPSNLCFTFMMLYNLTPIASPSALGTIAVRCKGGRLHQQVGTTHAMLTPDQQHEQLRITKSSCAITDVSKDIIVVMGLNIATAGRISLGVLESYHIYKMGL
jgi:hypothetical protein